MFLKKQARLRRLIAYIFQDEKTQVIALSILVRQYWNNAMLKWNSSQYANIGHINVDKNLVWVPDMVLYNS